jgi:hypothetical protein
MTSTRSQALNDSALDEEDIGESAITPRKEISVSTQVGRSMTLLTASDVTQVGHRILRVRHTLRAPHHTLLASYP